MVVKTRIHLHWMDGTAEVRLLSVPPVLVLWSMNASNSNTSNLWLLHAGCNKDPLYLRAGAMRCSAVQMQMRMRVNGSEQIGWLAGWHTHHSLEPILPMMLPRVHLYFTTCIHLQKKGASCLSIKIHHHLVYSTNWYKVQQQPNLMSSYRIQLDKAIETYLWAALKKKTAFVGGLVCSPFEWCSLHQIKEAVFRLLNGCCDQDRSSQGTNLVGWIAHCALQCETRYSIW